MGVGVSPASVSKTAALSAVAAVAERWGIQKTDRYRLIGVPESTANHWFGLLQRGKLDDREPLKPALLERISHVVSIYDLLHRLIKGDEADRWMHQPNAACGGQCPRELVLSGRSDDLLRVRWYLDRIASQ